ncbi:Dam family site-specific DNA-(adenine-N6)-methyltransferase [Streptococcus respiraculi]|uniref:Dam family site-specific DNA-(adenine-N6)-methyltransferase n=1 Tax=Streptococcus respiraculi TaxID=2021971 RepID=UPI001F0CD9C9|nr:Dam family site-specific DNA-(adenine-N6)-methyltransferase [Streptococcus respiraculi]
MTLTTKEIETKYNISRQTIQNWIKEGILPAPDKDFRNWYAWSQSDINNIEKIIKDKTKKNNLHHSDDTPLQISNRRYLGSKQKMLDFIGKVVRENTTGINTVADIFGGTGVVSDLFRKQGKKIIINDILHSNVISYKTWFGNQNVNYNKLQAIINELNTLKPIEDNYVSINFGDKYFSYENALKIGAVREKIDTYNINDRERAFLLTSLLYAMDKVANTVGHYDAYRKKLDTYTPLNLRLPENNINVENEIYSEDANDLVRKITADLVYIDTPYNSRQYGDAYHLLENIVDWSQPKLTGIALKMVNREHIKSKYSTSKAPEAFSDLIENINAKYILVSYNNMAKKGNGRSNAKISNEEIIEILSQKGKVKVFETPFKVFTTGKTTIDDHKELLYLCKVSQKSHKVKIKANQSPINYTGGKSKLIPQLLPLFPKDIDNFYDVFAGGANVSINITAKKYNINDINYKIIELLQYLAKSDQKTLIKNIEKIISSYNLSNTKLHGYDYYGVSSSTGLKDVNKSRYLKLRNDYNKGLFDEEINPLIFYILIVFGFNNQIRFNSKGEFNMPTGKRDFNEKMEKKLKTFLDLIKDRNVSFSTLDFRELLRNTKFNTNDFVYLDPPYLISTAVYNESGGWTFSDEADLLESLDKLNDTGIKFALSNVLVHKGEENALLINWAKKYKIHYLNFNYNNSNYQSRAKVGKTVEVLITNY